MDNRVKFHKHVWKVVKEEFLRTEEVVSTTGLFHDVYDYYALHMECIVPGCNRTKVEEGRKLVEKKRVGRV